MPIPVFRNTILKALHPDIILRLNLKPVVFEVEHEFEFPGKPIQHLFFVEAGMASMTVTFMNGAQVEVGTFGYESVIGVSALMGTKKSLNRVYTQIAGRGYSCLMEAARREFECGGQFQRLALAYVQAQLVQSAQSTACNAKHEVESRLARWLLICADRGNDDNFTMSHDFLAEMLGSTRPSVSIAARTLKLEGLIDYTRGEIRILDVAGLKKRSCECYQVIKDHLDHYANFSHSEDRSKDLRCVAL
ncbi:cAMP-binding domain of CRP or a regulatory subunit of cAMP-dependent protein kinases [Granulicella pectinivorans]|jgi:CRP-like cAMP-binding protein|uniref:cAMP-binding domain of CRP or a regulatory subunit of cAMP-dependent protein kinases n=1 Tax=Granulicella pectinivorans TaxID=474950 RepID=A0A1I6LRM1_9BACT|nr:Crp/Fnr family transcriptional regulator [Granulicella pectinivorans]SFS06094.1 cAMP-binding domain of CRP or a regulatory subunit of cAMP-dependent protein kinases [Granulicella pectinivorans]